MTRVLVRSDPAHGLPCASKRPIRSRKMAAKALTDMRRRYPGEHFDYYHCAACHQYHVGHVTQPGARR